MIGNFPVERFRNIPTPFYFYDTELLQQTLEEINCQSQDEQFHVHYALKACSNPLVLDIIQKAGIGADCVSGGEIKAALEAHIPANKIVYAGIGKTDEEIHFALDADIFCFNVESLPELEIINEIARSKNKIANIAIRVNPHVDAHTHHYITTGLEENKFGIDHTLLSDALNIAIQMNNINIIGLHFHIGSQITDMSAFQDLCVRINDLQDEIEAQGLHLQHINVGGGLGINYEHPNHFPIADFEGYFKVFRKNLKLRPRQQLHFELGRSIVGPCGSLITKVLYIKKGINKQFAIVDAGMNNLIRPALYGAYHRIENLTSEKPYQLYDIVGPICESADTFIKDYKIHEAQRGDLLAIRSTGAYGEVMASNYNLRNTLKAYTSEFINQLTE
ncbi:MAG: diaminopimelate decarboxylase [Paludibacteraceae bacterium]|nr:diaminopimelate decarboxylase [Paludibacteraceae bacterium]